MRLIAMVQFVYTHIYVRKNRGKRVVDRGLNVDYGWQIGNSVFTVIIPFNKKGQV
jgi:hypothetical protein